MVIYLKSNAITLPFSNFALITSGIYSSLPKSFPSQPGNISLPIWMVNLPSTQIYAKFCVINALPFSPVNPEINFIFLSASETYSF